MFDMTHKKSPALGGAKNQHRGEVNATACNQPQM
jgi:hypothetical protein